MRPGGILRRCARSSIVRGLLVPHSLATGPAARWSPSARTPRTRAQARSPPSSVGTANSGSVSVQPSSDHISSRTFSWPTTSPFTVKATERYAGAALSFGSVGRGQRCRWRGAPAGRGIRRGVSRRGVLRGGSGRLVVAVGHDEVGPHACGDHGRGGGSRDQPGPPRPPPRGSSRDEPGGAGIATRPRGAVTVWGWAGVDDAAAGSSGTGSELVGGGAGVDVWAGSGGCSDVGHEGGVPGAVSTGGT